MLRLHECYTEWPWDTPLAEELSCYIAYPEEYGSFKLVWEHLYYGSAKFANGCSWCIEPGWEICGSPPSMHHRSPYSDMIIQWICTDLLSIPGLTSYVLSHLQPLIDGEARETTKPREVDLPRMHPTTTFEALPTEIINGIVSFLPAIPTLRLRRCSSRFYAKCASTKNSGLTTSFPVTSWTTSGIWMQKKSIKTRDWVVGIGSSSHNCFLMPSLSRALWRRDFVER